ncbi:MAG: hypothetical protein ACFFBP_14310 [Promethearchaeota archaeon]
MKIKEIFKFNKKHAFIYLGFILTVILFLYIFIGNRQAFPSIYTESFINIIPGPLITDILILYFLPIVIVFIILKFAPSISSVYLKVHKTVYLGRKTLNYGIVELKQERKIWTLLRRAFLIGFLAFSFSSNLVFAQLGGLFRAHMIPMKPGDEALLGAEAMFLGTFLFTSSSFLIVLPIWIIEDTGIMVYRTFPEELRTPSVKGAYRLFEQLIEGYTGINTVITLVVIISNVIPAVLGTHGMIVPIILIILPLLVIGLFAFALIIYENSVHSTIQKMHDKLSKKGYQFISIPNFNEITYQKEIKKDLKE